MFTQKIACLFFLALLYLGGQFCIAQESGLLDAPVTDHITIDVEIEKPSAATESVVIPEPSTVFGLSCLALAVGGGLLVRKKSG